LAHVKSYKIVVCVGNSFNDQFHCLRFICFHPCVVFASLSDSVRQHFVVLASFTTTVYERVCSLAA
jgi:hypothetical protein